LSPPPALPSQRQPQSPEHRSPDSSAKGRPKELQPASQTASTQHRRKRNASPPPGKYSGKSPVVIVNYKFPLPHRLPDSKPPPQARDSQYVIGR
jgi:hypothetical protein